jgi:hypothetical protein
LYRDILNAKQHQTAQTTPKQKWREPHVTLGFSFEQRAGSELRHQRRRNAVGLRNLSDRIVPSADFFK